MKRIESKASAAMRSASALLRWAAGLEAAAVLSKVTVDMMIFLCRDGFSGRRYYA
jgi:hypothetical protein